MNEGRLLFYFKIFYYFDIIHLLQTKNLLMFLILLQVPKHTAKSGKVYY